MAGAKALGARRACLAVRLGLAALLLGLPAAAPLAGALGTEPGDFVWLHTGPAMVVTPPDGVPRAAVPEHCLTCGALWRPAVGTPAEGVWKVTGLVHAGTSWSPPGSLPDGILVFRLAGWEGQSVQEDCPAVVGWELDYGARTVRARCGPAL